MKKNLQQLAEIIEQEKGILVELLIANDIEEAECTLKRIEIAEKQISEGLKKKRKMVSVGLITLIILCISLIYCINLPKCNVSVETIHSGFSVYLQEKWNSNLFIECESIRLNRLNAAYVFPSIREFDSIDKISVLGSKLVLKKVKISSSAQIEFDQYRQDGLIMIIRNGAISCELQIDSGSYELDDVKFPISENEFGLKNVIHLVSDTVVNYSEPIVMRFLGISYLKMDLPAVDSVYFAKPLDQQGGTYISSIISGEIVFEETMNSKKLGNFFKLLLINDRIIRFTTVNDENGLKSHLQGSIKKAVLKTGNQEKNLKPSLLEYFSHNQPLAMIWSAIVFLTGLIWSMKNSLFKN